MRDSEFDYHQSRKGHNRNGRRGRDDKPQYPFGKKKDANPIDLAMDWFLRKVLKDPGFWPLENSDCEQGKKDDFDSFLQQPTINTKKKQQAQPPPQEDMKKQILRSELFLDAASALNNLGLTKSVAREYAIYAIEQLGLTAKVEDLVHCALTKRQKK